MPSKVPERPLLDSSSQNPSLGFLFQDSSSSTALAGFLVQDSLLRISLSRLSSRVHPWGSCKITPPGFPCRVLPAWIPCLDYNATVPL